MEWLYSGATCYCKLPSQTYTVLLELIKSYRIFLDCSIAGHEAWLSFEYTISTVVHCTFDLKMYPFDSQSCYISVVLENAEAEVTFDILSSQNVTTLIPTTIEAEYTLISVKVFDPPLSKGTLVIVFDFMRNPMYHIFSTYIPTLILLLIAYGTTFIDVNNFSDRGTMSLTTLLLQIALFSDMVASMPVTQYLKYLEIWFICSFVYLALIIVTHLLTNYSNHILKVVPVSVSSNLPALQASNNKKIISFMRIALGLLLFGFVAGYSCSLYLQL